MARVHAVEHDAGEGVDGGVDVRPFGGRGRGAGDDRCDLEKDSVTCCCGVVAVGEDAGLGEDVLQEQALAPSGVREHHVRPVAGAAQLDRSAGDDLAAMDGAAQPAERMRHLARLERIDFVGDQAGAGDFAAPAQDVADFAQTDDFVAAVGGVMARQVAELRGKILVHEEELHGVDRRSAPALNAQYAT